MFTPHCLRNAIISLLVTRSRPSNADPLTGMCGMMFVMNAPSSAAVFVTSKICPSLTPFSVTQFTLHKIPASASIFIPANWFAKRIDAPSTPEYVFPMNATCL